MELRITKIFYILFLVATVAYSIFVLSWALVGKQRSLRLDDLPAAIVTPVILGIVSFCAGFLWTKIARKIGLVTDSIGLPELAFIYFFKGLFYHGIAGAGLSAAIAGVNWLYTLPFFAISFGAVLHSFPSEEKLRKM